MVQEKGAAKGQARTRRIEAGENLSPYNAMTDDAVGALSSLVGYHLRRAYGAFLSDFAVAMEGTGMRQVLVGVLAVVSREPGINQGSAGKLLGIKRANMVSLINELVEAGLVDRVVDRDDRRAFALSLTTAGEAKLNDCLTRIAAHEKRMLTALSASERTTLIKMLGRIKRLEAAEA